MWSHAQLTLYSMQAVLVFSRADTGKLSKFQVGEPNLVPAHTDAIKISTVTNVCARSCTLDSLISAETEIEWMKL